MISFKKQLTERETLRLNMIMTMIKQNKERLEKTHEMNPVAERVLYIFCKQFNVKRADMLEVALSKDFLRHFNHLRQTHAISI